MFFKDRLLSLRKIAVLQRKVAAGKLPLIITLWLCVKLPASFLYNFRDYFCSAFLCSGFHSCLSSLVRVSYRGGEAGIPPSILKLSMVIILAIYMLLNISMCLQMLFGNFVPDCVRSNLRGHKFKIFMGAMPPDPPSRHTHVSHATIILLPSCSPPHLRIMYETLYQLL